MLPQGAILPHPLSSLPKCPSPAYPSDNLAPMLPPSNRVPWVLHLMESTHLIHSLCPGCSSIITLTTHYYHNSNIIIIVIATLNVSLFSHQFTMNDSMISILWCRELKPKGVKKLLKVTELVSDDLCWEPRFDVKLWTSLSFSLGYMRPQRAEGSVFITNSIRLHKTRIITDGPWLMMMVQHKISQYYDGAKAFTFSRNCTLTFACGHKAIMW